MKKLPGGPRSGLWHMLADPYDATLGFQRKYGDPFTYSSLGDKFFITGNPEGIKAIMTADPDTFEPPFGESLGVFLGKSSLFMMSGAAHRAARKLLMPPFHGARMRAYGTLMRDTTLRWLRDLVPGRRFVMQDLTQAITLDIIIEAVFGVRGAERIRRFHDDLVATVASFSPLIVVFKFLRHNFLGVGPWARFQRRFSALRQLVFEEIAAHRAAPEGRQDILSLLILARHEDGGGLSDQEIFEHLLTLLMAGHETTALALAWACYFLHRNPQVLDRLRAELATLGAPPQDADPEAIAKLPYLEAVCQECLRLRPLPIVSRKLARPLTVLGYELPAGMLLGAGAYLVHMNPELYPEPEQFRPERFRDRTYSPFEYLPFGGGARRCIGAAFAMYEMKIVLATLLATSRLELAEKKPVKSVMRAATVGPKGGVRMILTERLS